MFLDILPPSHSYVLRIVYDGQQCSPLQPNYSIAFPLNADRIAINVSVYLLDCTFLVLAISSIYFIPTERVDFSYSYQNKKYYLLLRLFYLRTLFKHYVTCKTMYANI
jgi:hypothetical protein